jgi:hypothetical protein
LRWDPKELHAYFLTCGILEYFEIIEEMESKEGLVVVLEEKPLTAVEGSGKNLHSKGLYPTDQI